MPLATYDLVAAVTILQMPGGGTHRNPAQIALRSRWEQKAVRQRETLPRWDVFRALNCTTQAVMASCSRSVDNESPREPEVLRCEKCRSMSVKVATASGGLLVIACRSCGSAWTMPERRRSVRMNPRTSKFPLPPDVGES